MAAPRLRSRTGYEEFLASGDPADPGLDIDPDSALLVIYTAAISGRQCGSMLSHTNLITMGMSVAWLGDIDNATVFLNSGPMFHIGNFQFFGIPVLLQGGTNVVTRRVVAERGAGHPGGGAVHPRVPHAGHHHPAGPADAGARGGTAAPEGHHRRPRCGRAWWRPDDSRHGREGGGMGYGYGQTEVTGFCLVGGYGGKGAGNAGRPAPMTRVRILDADGRECPVGEAGEICLRGDTVHLGYWNRPEINAERFRVGWWHTTDLGRREPDGTITFLGTMTRMIKSGAENIFPAEVENCLEAHPAVKEAAVIGIPNERFLQDVKAVVVLNGAPRRPPPSSSSTASATSRRTRSRRPSSSSTRCRAPRFAKDYAALDEKFGGGGYPGGANLGAGH